MSGNDSLDDQLNRGAEAIRSAKALLIGAGAGMGVDSGLPDFRGRAGFWNAYPPFAKLGLDFASLANPRWFDEDPELAWGFYGQRLMLYRETVPHEGFEILHQWASRMPGGGFVYTSNVDGHFQKAGFSADQIYEVHGSIHALQCVGECGIGIYSAEASSPEIDLETMRAIPPLPQCPRCGALARPNILMFGDWGWDPSVSDDQRRQFKDWLESIGEGPVAVMECGAGMEIPTVRSMCEDIGGRLGTLIRVNMRESQVRPGQISLPMRALDALRELDRRLR